MTLTIPCHREKRAFCTILYHQSSSSKHFNKLSQSHNNPQQRTVRCYFTFFHSFCSLMYLNHMLSFCFTTNTSARLRIHLQSFFFSSRSQLPYISLLFLFFWPHNCLFSNITSHDVERKYVPTTWKTKGNGLWNEWEKEKKRNPINLLSILIEIFSMAFLFFFIFFALDIVLHVQKNWMETITFNRHPLEDRGSLPILNHFIHDIRIKMYLELSRQQVSLNTVGFMHYAWDAELNVRDCWNV